MEIIELRKLVDEFENIMIDAFKEKYSALPKEIKDSFFQSNPVIHWDLRKFLDDYLKSGIYPQERLGHVLHNLFDIKLQLYYILEVDLGLYNVRVFDRGYDKDEPLRHPHILLTRFSYDQSLIAKSRILWERIMNFVYYLETGASLEDKVSGKKSKQKVFFDYVTANRKWIFLEPYKNEIYKYDKSYRTPEFHKSSILRAELFGNRQSDPDDLLILVRRAMNVVWENILAIVSGEKPSHFTDLHYDADGLVDKKYTTTNHDKDSGIDMKRSTEMPEHDFTPLYDQYLSIIAQMPQTFTSHQFILELAHQHQTLYVEALYSYRHHVHRDAPAPFLIVHGVLAQHLAAYPNLIEQVQKLKASKDIFGQDSSCSEWRKIM